MQTIEVVIFPAKAGVSAKKLQTAALEITPVFAAMPGFISREFGICDDGQFIDMIHWENRAVAEAAAEKVMHIPVCCAYFDLMDQSRMQFRYVNKVL